MANLKEQFKEITEKGSKGLFNLNSKQVKMVTWGAYLVIAVVLLTVLSNSLTSKKTINEPGAAIVPNQPQGISRSETDISLAEQELEERWAKILSQIKGAGKVSVNITLGSGSSYQYAVNQTANKKTIKEQINDGSREIEENTDEETLVITRGQSNNEVPVIVKESRPVIQGVLVVAEGADDPRVRQELSRSVETGLGISSYQVHVVPKER